MKKNEYLTTLETQQQMHYWQSVAYGVCLDILKGHPPQHARVLIKREIEPLLDATNVRYSTSRRVYEEILRTLLEVEEDNDGRTP